MKREFKQRWSTIPPISTKRISTSLFTLIEHSKTTTNTKYDDWNACPGLEQAHKCNRVKPINAISGLRIYSSIL
jgi:hypothetical protein